MSTGRLRIEPTDIDLTDVVRSTLEGIAPAAEAKQIDVSADVTPAPFHGDAERLRQMVWNLVSNAVKYTPRQGKVWLRLRREQDDVVLAVEDTGPGIPEHFLGQVFDAFRQATGGSARSHGGLGLGLSIAKHVVELHGGTITAANRDSGGAIFTVRLPVAASLDQQSPSPSVPATVDSGTASPSSSAVSGVRVLIVDDEPDAREMLALLLELCGMRVRVADSAASARAQLDDFEPQVILSDIGMPNEDGYAFIRSVRTSANERWRNVPAIALTGFSRHADRTQSLVSGFNAHLVKPVDRAVLVQTIQEVTGARADGQSSESGD
jgi:CheY-like chemotaxis protein